MNTAATGQNVMVFGEKKKTLAEIHEGRHLAGRDDGPSASNIGTTPGETEKVDIGGFFLVFFFFFWRGES